MALFRRFADYQRSKLVVYSEKKKRTVVITSTKKIHNETEDFEFEFWVNLSFCEHIKAVSKMSGRN